MDGARRFRSQLGGYNKDDVNGYIKETDLKHAAEADALREEITALREELEQKEAALQSAAEEAEAARKTAEDRVSELTAALEQEKTVSAEAERRRTEQKAAAESELWKLREKAEALSSDLLALRGEKDAADGRIAEALQSAGINANRKG